MPSPRLITAESLSLQFRDVFGPLGPVRHVTGHFSGGARAGDWRQATSLARQLHVDHLDTGWGGCGYHFLISDDGTLLCLRPTYLQGAHVGGHNGANLGVCCAGTSGHRPTRAQRETYAWLIAHAHTAELPYEHRTGEDLRDAELLAHHMWHGHSTNPCAGWFDDLFVSGTNQPPMGLAPDAGAPRVLSDGYPAATDVRGIVADGCHVSLVEAHQAAACRDRDTLAGADRDEPVRPSLGRLAIAVQHQL